jgi:eukaryotic-like serine/threonine-protein kinase
MGLVFRGVDTRLGRAVAIKTSQEKFSDRFQREARAISSINHPHICTLYDLGTDLSGTSYLVMELVEGETLAARLKRGRLSLDETLALRLPMRSLRRTLKASCIATSSRRTSW